MGARWQRIGRRWRRALAVALVLVAALFALWLLRKPIASRYVDRTLAAAKVPARYTIADLGLGGQRLTNVVIGDPAAPDLVADWIETRTRITARGPELSGVRAGRLRLRGRLVDGRLSLGSIDRLLPKGDGGPFALPALDLDVEDGRMRLEMPYGIAGVSLKGSGRLDGRFDGRLAVVSERLGTGDCAGERIGAVMALATRRTSARESRVTLAGPINAAHVACADLRVAGWRSDMRASLNTGARPTWTLDARLATQTASGYGARASGLSGVLELAQRRGGGDLAITGTARLTAAAPQGFGARAGQLTVSGPVGIDGGGWALGEGGRAAATLEGAQLPPDWRGRIAAIAEAAPGTPVAPLLGKLARASGEAAHSFDGTATFGIVANPNADNSALVRALNLRAASGARLSWSGRADVAWGRERDLAVVGRVAIGGGGLPTLSAEVRQEAGRTPRAILRLRPYEANGARLAASPVMISGGRVVTRVVLSGPLGDGRVEGLAAPLDLRFTRRGLLANPACTPVAFDRLALAGLRLQPARFTLCPTAGALVRVADNGVSGGARLGAPRLAGTLGSAPVALGLAGGTLRLADRGFALERVEARLGPAARVTRLDFARLEGRAGAEGIAGTFAGGGGQIANVPLLLSDAAGDWRFAAGKLSLGGALQVRDAQAPNPRFQPMQARAVALSLADNTIRATATLHEPTTGTRVADVAITHALGSGAGSADLSVPNLIFAKDFQPDLLTRLTYGVVADVAGTVSGEGHIAWSPQGVTSTGTFRTAGTDLAAAFGPVTGLAGELRFTDLLALESAPGQVVTLKSVNPGVPVTDGTIRYRLLPNTRVRIEGGEWPFAGGRLLLEGSTLDFSATAERRMTFRVEGVAADRFLQQFDFKNLDATGTFDGVLPMVFDQAGGRIEGGRMTVREGGGTIRYVGELTEEDLGFWGNFAFQALKSLQYRSLAVTMNGPLAGEMITDVRFAGVRQGEGAKTNFLVRRLQRLPLVFNIRIKAPFRSLLDSAQGFYDPRRLIQRNLPALLEAGSAEPNQAAPALSPAPPPSQDNVLGGGAGERAGAAPARAGQTTRVQPPESAPVAQETK